MTTQLHNKVLMATVKELVAAQQKGSGKADNTNSLLPCEEETSKKRAKVDEKGRLATKSLSLSEEEPLSVGAARAQRELSLDLSLDSYPSTDSLHVLGELLCDIRRSCTASLTSTPVSSDGGEFAGVDTVFESKLRRSEKELREMSESSIS